MCANNDCRTESFLINDFGQTRMWFFFCATKIADDNSAFKFQTQLSAHGVGEWMEAIFQLY